MEEVFFLLHERPAAAWFPSCEKQNSTGVVKSAIAGGKLFFVVLQTATETAAPRALKKQQEEISRNCLWILRERETHVKLDLDAKFTVITEWSIVIICRTTFYGHFVFALFGEYLSSREKDI